MAEFALTEYLKTSAHDVFNVDVSNSVTYGLGGNDRFTANSEAVFVVGAGGWGNDTYLPGAGIMIVADHGGGYDTINFDGFFSFNDTLTTATLDGGKHLLFLNTTTHAALVIANWRHASYKIEEFQVQGQTTYIDQYIQFVSENPGAFEDVPFSALATIDDGKFVSISDKAKFDYMLGLINKNDLSYTLQAEAQGVGRLYEAGLNRQADIDGLNYWYDVYMGIGRDKAALSKAFIDSAEFEQNFGDPYAQSAESFINVLYLNVLGRKSDAAGAFYWTELLNSGALSREDALLSFADSAENMAQSPYLAGIVDAGGGDWAFS